MIILHYVVSRQIWNNIGKITTERNYLDQLKALWLWCIQHILLLPQLHQRTWAMKTVLIFILGKYSNIHIAYNVIFSRKLDNHFLVLHLLFPNLLSNYFYIQKMMQFIVHAEILRWSLLICKNQHWCY